MADTDEVGRMRRVPRWMRILLLLSLALNLAVAGILVGGAIKQGRGDGPRPVVLRDISLGLYSEAMTPEDRAALRDVFRQNLPALHDMREAQRAEQGRLLQALRAQPFAPAPVAEILAAQRERLTRGTELGHEALLARIAQMDDAERAAFAGRLEEVLSRPGPHRRPGGGESRSRGGGTGGP